MPTKILIVDDNPTIRIVLAKAFRPYDCDVFEACDGLEGMAIAVREKPDLILLDLAMPVMDGIDMLAQLRADSELKSIPVIMLTAESDRENIFQIVKLGVRDYILKPFHEKQLLERTLRIVPLQKKDHPVASVL